MPRALQRVLYVDDDPSVLAVMRRMLGSRYDITSVDRPAAALELLRDGPSFAVIVSDLTMPGLNGVEFLRRVRQLSPRSVRVLLSGQAALQDAVDAVNEGQIFRFLLKPIHRETLLAVMADATAQHRVVAAERDLLEQTLHGAVETLSDVLAMAQPAAFGRAKRLRRHIADLAAAIKVPDTWEMEIAALLSQLGCVSLPPETVGRLYHAQPMTLAERAQVARLPAIAEALIAHIPRLERVREIIRHQELRFDGDGTASGDPSGTDICLGARMLHIGRDFDFMIGEGLGADKVLELMVARTGVYDPELLHAFAGIRSSGAPMAATCDMRLGAVTEGMIFAADLLGPAGILLVARGQVVTANLLHRIRDQWSDFARARTVRMVVRG